MKKKIGFFAVCIAILIVVPVRIYQYFNNIEIKTGFYTSNDLTNLIFTGVLLAAAVISVVLFWQTKKSYQEINYPSENKKNRTIAVLLLLTAVGYVFFITENVAMAVAYPQQNSPLTLLLYTVFSVLAVIGFTYMAVKLLIGKGYPNAILCIFPLPILLIRLIQTYIVNFNIQNISEFPIHILMVNASLLFYLFFARTISGYQSKKYNTCACIFSALCALCSFASAGARIGVQMIDAAYITVENQPYAADIATGCLAIVFLGFLTFAKTKPAVVPEDQQMDDDGFVRISKLDLGALEIEK